MKEERQDSGIGNWESEVEMQGRLSIDFPASPLMGPES
jgi:hypothetical protein